ncbi:MAG: helix-turn-helix transcriptional regulator [Lachnospiraceae bacterium]|nr:helix-turn-helix transcriptional regulator [Lachnospiraceae bacterium]
MNWKIIGQNIKKKRIEKSWSQAVLAEKADLSIAYIGMIERGKKLPRLETLVKIANVLEATSDELLEGAVNKQPEIRMSEYITRMKDIPEQDRERIYEVLDILLKYGKKGK